MRVNPICKYNSGHKMRGKLGLFFQNGFSSDASFFHAGPTARIRGDARREQAFDCQRALNDAAQRRRIKPLPVGEVG